jgi:hypothetical protein
LSGPTVVLRAHGDCNAVTYNPKVITMCNKKDKGIEQSEKNGRGGFQPQVMLTTTIGADGSIQTSPGLNTLE